MVIRSVVIVFLVRLVVSQAQVVQTTSGSVQGSTDANGLLKFRGIPFAAPPVGVLRFARPVPPTRSSVVINASSFGPSCIQPLDDASNQQALIHLVSPEVSEDCLTLNVWTSNVTGTMPVMFWIYGGGLVTGGTNSFDYYGEVSNVTVMSVTVNFTLNLRSPFLFDRN
jgi:para-nitrobenzyl esterase